MSGDTFDFHHWGWGTTGISWVKAIPQCTELSPTAKNYQSVIDYPTSVHPHCHYPSSKQLLTAACVTEYNNLLLTFLSSLQTMVKGSFLKTAPDLSTFLLKTLWCRDTGSFSPSLRLCLFSLYPHPPHLTHTCTHTTGYLLL